MIVDGAHSELSKELKLFLSMPFECTKQNIQSGVQSYLQYKIMVSLNKHKTKDIEEQGGGGGGGPPHLYNLEYETPKRHLWANENGPLTFLCIMTLLDEH